MSTSTSTSKCTQVHEYFCPRSDIILYKYIYIRPGAEVSVYIDIIYFLYISIGETTEYCMSRLKFGVFPNKSITM